MGLASVGCTGLAHATGTPISPPEATALIAVHVGAAGGYRIQNTVHRWVAADVYRYDVSLTDLSSPSAPVVASTSIAAQGGPSEATFAHLRPDGQYRATVLAMGNLGADGSAPLEVLNTQTPSTIDLDFTGTQNLQETLSATASVTLDSVPFSGSLMVTATPPTGTATVSASLYDADHPGTPLFTQTFGGSPAAVSFDHLSTGISYQAILTAYQQGASGLEMATASSEPFLFDPLKNDLSTTASATASPWSPWQATGSQASG